MAAAKLKSLNKTITVKNLKFLLCNLAQFVVVVVVVAVVVVVVVVVV